jgi:hypothetical protein
VRNRRDAEKENANCGEEAAEHKSNFHGAFSFSGQSNFKPNGA